MDHVLGGKSLVLRKYLCVQTTPLLRDAFYVGVTSNNVLNSELKRNEDSTSCSIQNLGVQNWPGLDVTAVEDEEVVLE